MAKPVCASTQQFSITLPSISTRRAFFSSNRFFTDHALPANDGWPFFHESGLLSVLRRNSTSLGISPLTLGSAPPSIKFSPDPSSVLLTILNGPGPFHPQMACASAPASWQSATVESMIAVRALLSATPRRRLPVGLP